MLSEEREERGHEDVDVDDLEANLSNLTLENIEEYLDKEDMRTLEVEATIKLSRRCYLGMAGWGMHSLFSADVAGVRTCMVEDLTIERAIVKLFRSHFFDQQLSFCWKRFSESSGNPFTGTILTPDGCAKFVKEFPKHLGPLDARGWKTLDWIKHPDRLESFMELVPAYEIYAMMSIFMRLQQCIRVVSLSKMLFIEK
jgi:hypothetical protein